MTTLVTDTDGLWATVRGHDIGDWIDDLCANALTRTGLGGPKGPEPQSVSALRAPSLSQVSSTEKGAGGQ